MSSKVAFAVTSEVPSDMNEFLQSSDNKRELNVMLAKYAVNPLRCISKQVFVTQKENKVLTSHDGPIELFRAWIPETHEEADNRLILHIEKI